ncbi:hypothetical protein BO221_04640 [Archangium sp. Cb G35]|uniref:DUF6348 family protein n=1 Tax=Archangium sp. Cb G35 TaxID=1920190 RepID=UPI000937A9B4|nr:DUF6348 family protein [Archangium sp. Cb G35]OJT27276.1 hypothetical protein BO221_04640 [Archangium sp. Cb G35]
MNASPALEPLRELLQLHDVTCLEEGQWLRLGPSGPRAQAWFVNAQTHPKHCSVQLDVVLEPWTGRVLIESFAGFGETAQEAERDAFENLARCSLHVLLGAFVRTPDEHVTLAEWEISGVRRRVILGNIQGRGAQPSAEATRTWFQELERALATLPLVSGTHWVRVYYAQQSSRPMTLEVLLDNEEWPELKEALGKAPWPRAPHFFSQRLFLVLQGGVDVSRAVAAFVDPPNRDDELIDEELRAQGATPLEAEKLVAYLPLAFAQVLMHDMGPRFANMALFVTDGSRHERPVFLPEDPLWREALRLAEKALVDRSLTGEQFNEIALRSATAHVLNNALKAGSKPEDLVFTPALITLSDEAAAELHNQVPAIRSPAPAPPPPGPPAPPRKPWWKFW